MSSTKMSKSRMHRDFHRNVFPPIMAGILWILIVLNAWTYCAWGEGLPVGPRGGKELPILGPGSPNVANVAIDLKVEARCDPVKLMGTARLSWKPASPPGSQQRVDMTMFRDGFQTGKFTTLGPLHPDQSQVEFNAGEPGINYYWRVLTLTESAWAPSKAERLPWPICPVDRRP